MPLLMPKHLKELRKFGFRKLWYFIPGSDHDQYSTEPMKGL
jgi:hypothetical protein